MAKTFGSETVCFFFSSRLFSTTVCLGQLWGRCLHSDNLAEGFTFRSFAQDPALWMQLRDDFVKFCRNR